MGSRAERRRRAVIQLASSLRNVGRADESVALLTAELDAEPDELDDAVRAFLALALVDVGREREAVSHALTALAPHLPRYQRSLANYARCSSGNGRRGRGSPRGYPSAISATPPTTSAAPREPGRADALAERAARRGSAAISTLVSRTEATAAADARSSAASTSA